MFETADDLLRLQRLRQALLDIYVPRYGAEWESFLDSGTSYARINAHRMFTFSMRELGEAGSR